MQGFLALTWIELKLFVRDPFATVFALVFPFMMMLLLAAVFGDTPPDDEVNGVLVFRGVSGDDYYVAASVAVVVAAIGLLVLPVSLASDRERGVLRRFRASGLPVWSLFGAYIVLGVCVAVAGSVLMVAAASPIYGTMFPDDPVGVIAAFLLAMLCFTALGLVIASLVHTARAAQGIGLILFFAVWMLSGTAPPLAVLPSGVQDVAQFEPLTHVVVAIQDPWFGYGWNGEKLLILLAVTVVASALALWRFRWS